jgi:hypothetical protein|tara:strand:- start:138 stop:362 length:225 start_codon:yes stop_codon:yes gene_type:complete
LAEKDFYQHNSQSRLTPSRPFNNILPLNAPSPQGWVKAKGGGAVVIYGDPPKNDVNTSSKKLLLTSTFLHQLNP